MTKLLTTTAIGLVAAFAIQVQAQTAAQTSDAAEVGGPCQQQWTAVDENKDGKISEEEAQRAVAPEFSRIDMDGNGTISVKEWKDCVAPSAIPGGMEASAGTATAERAIGEADAGEEDQETTGQAGTAGSPETAGSAEWWTEEQFSEMDADQSGDVSAGEASEWSRTQAGAEPGDEEAARAEASRFAMLDSDGDRKVTWEEWQTRDQASVETRFLKLDRDRDGQISMSEWQEHRKEGFDQAQSNGDGAVDLWLFYYNII